MIRRLGAEKVSNTLLTQESVGLAEALIRRGRYDEADRIHRAALDSASGGKPQTLRHRYRLVLSAIRRGKFEDAHGQLLEMDVLMDLARRLSEAYPVWLESYLGENHHLQLAWGKYYVAMGAVDRAYEYRGRAMGALEPFLDFLGETNPRRFHRQFTHAEFEANLFLAAGRYQTAHESLDEWIQRLRDHPATVGPPAETRARVIGQLRRMRASTLQLLASKGEQEVAVARDALVAALEEAQGQRLVELELIYALVKLEVLAGRLGEAARFAARAPMEGLSPQDTCLSIALRLSCAEGDDRGSWAAKMELALGKLLESWLQEEPRPGGRGWLHYNQVRFSLNALLRARLNVPAQAEWAPVEGAAAEWALDSLLPVLEVNDLARRLGAPALGTTSELQVLLREGELALLLSPGQLPGVGFAITRTTVTAFPMAGRSRCRDALANLRGVIAPGSGAGWDPAVSVPRWTDASREVAAAFFPGEIMGRIAASREVLLFARGMGLQLPLESLLVDGEALCLKCSIADLPTPAVLSLLRTRQARRGSPSYVAPGPAGPVIVANVPSPDWGDPRVAALPSIRLGDEALDAWSLALGPSTRVVQGSAASVEAFAGGLLRHAPMGVVYAHGCLGEDPERPSAMLVGSTGEGPGLGQLSSLEVETMPVADAMFLAACGSSRAPQRVGAWGSNHLGGAFLLAGARVVIQSPSDLPAEPTARLLRTFLEEAGRGETLGNALLKARRSVAAGGAAVPPSHYALPILFGLPETSVAAPRPQSIPLPARGPLGVAALVLTATALLVLMGRRRSSVPDH